jgi:hypothetical protein
MKELFKRKWVRIGAMAAVCVVLVYGLIYVDVLLRARSAYLEGEKYWSWYEHPEQKEKALTAVFDKEKALLDKKLAGKNLTQEDYARGIEIAQFNRDRQKEESSIKYAYIWYQTVVELFSPPESKWVKLSREKMPRARELWKQELKGKNIPFEDYMLE